MTLHKKTNKTFVAECRFGAAARQCAKAEPLTVSMLRCKTFVAGCRFGAAARQCAKVKPFTFSQVDSCHQSHKTRVVSMSIHYHSLVGKSIHDSGSLSKK